MSDKNSQLEKEVTDNVKKDDRKKRKAEKKENRKLKKAEKKAAKKAAYHALDKGHKVKFWAIRIAVAIIITCVVGYGFCMAKEFVSMAYITGRYYYSLEQPVEREKILELVVPDEEGDARVEAMDPYSKDDTWAIYLYMCGSNLESLGRDSTSDLIKVLTANESAQYMAIQAMNRNVWMEEYMDEIQRQGMDLPAFMYEPALREKTTDSYEEEMQWVEPGYSSNDLDEIFTVELPENVKIIIQTGGANDWSNAMVNPNRSQRFIYDKDGLRMLEDNHIQNMGDGQTFADFLKYCKDEHPADHTMLSVWNHGGGAFGFANDEIYGMDGITLAECEAALAQVFIADEDNPPFELIGFDACLMASMEVAEALHGYGRFMAASEEIEGGDGWNYTAWLSELAANPGMNGAQVGKAIADSFVEYYAEQTIQLSWMGADFESTFSVVDLNKAHEVYEAYMDLMRRALQDMGENTGVIAQLSQAACGSIHYSGDSYDVINTLDLGQFMMNLSAEYPEEAGKVLSKLEDAVIYNRAFSYAADSMGLSVYYPANIDDIYGIYYYLEYMNSVCKDPAMNAVYYYKLAGCMGEKQQEYIKSQGYKVPEKMNIENLSELSNLPIDFGEGANLSVTLEEDTAKLIQNITLCIARIEEEEQKLIFYGQDDFLVRRDETGTLATDFNAEWVSIGGEPFMLEIIYTNDKVIRYRSPIKWKNENAYLVLSYDCDTEETSIIGVQTMDEIAGADSMLRKVDMLMPGDKIKPLYYVYYEESDSIVTEEGKEIGYNAGRVIQEETLKDGKYVEFLRVIDPRGDKYYTERVAFEIKNGKVKNMTIKE